MRAMSLAIDEGESEQNEMRNLQEKLESTTRLVFTLSQQLLELKEQVRLGNPRQAYSVHLASNTEVFMICPRSVSRKKKKR